MRNISFFFCSVKSMRGSNVTYVCMYKCDLGAYLHTHICTYVCTYLHMWVNNWRLLLPRVEGCLTTKVHMHVGTLKRADCWCMSLFHHENFHTYVGRHYLPSQKRYRVSWMKNSLLLSYLNVHFNSRNVALYSGIKHSKMPCSLI
jgi:hypothetical protein